MEYFSNIKQVGIIIMTNKIDSFFIYEYLLLYQKMFDIDYKTIC